MNKGVKACLFKVNGSFAIDFNSARISPSDQ